MKGSGREGGRLNRKKASVVVMCVSPVYMARGRLLSPHIKPACIIQMAGGWAAVGMIKPFDSDLRGRVRRRPRRGANSPRLASPRAWIDPVFGKNFSAYRTRFYLPPPTLPSPPCLPTIESTPAFFRELFRFVISSGLAGYLEDTAR